MVKVNKGYVQLNGNYIKVEPENEDEKEFCKKFEAQITDSP